MANIVILTGGGIGSRTHQEIQEIRHEKIRAAEIIH